MTCWQRRRNENYTHNVRPADNNVCKKNGYVRKKEEGLNLLLIPTYLLHWPKDNNIAMHKKIHLQLFILKYRLSFRL